MSIIIKDKDPFISLILTEYGKKQLALGRLNFSYYAFGDSDINYKTVNIHSATLKPFLGLKDLKTPLFKNKGGIFYQITDENISVESITKTETDEEQKYKYESENILKLNSKYINFPGKVVKIVNNYTVEIEFNEKIKKEQITPYDYLVFNIYAQKGVILKNKSTFINRAQIDVIDAISDSRLKLTLKQPVGSYVLNCETHITKFNLMFTEDGTWNQVYLGGPQLKQKETRFDGIAEYFKEEHGLLVYKHKIISPEDFNYVGGEDIEIDIPEIFYSKSASSKMGIKLKNSGELKRQNIKTNTNFILEYYQLIDEYNNVVGKYYPQLKCFIITDIELSTTLADKNRRNWTLPEFDFEYISSNGNGIFNKTNEDLYLTYYISGNYHNNTNYCQYVKKIQNKKGDLQLELDFTKFNFKLMNSNNWLANNISILFQFVKSGKSLNPNNWFEVPMLKSEKLTENLIKGKYTMNINHLLKGVKFNTDKTFNMDEQPFFGNVKLSKKTSIYKTNFSFGSENNITLYSKNPTYSNDKQIRVSEVAIYDDKYKAVGLIKLSHSIKWRPDVSFTIKSSLII